MKLAGLTLGAIGLAASMMTAGAPDARAQSAPIASPAPAPQPGAATKSKVPRAAAIARSKADVSDNTSFFEYNNDQNHVRLELKGDTVVKAERNGKSIPTERVQRDGDHISIIDENGDVVFEYTMADVP